MSDWTTDAANLIERTVGTVRDRTVEPAHKAVRVVVFGIMAALIATPAAILLFVGLFRIIVIIERATSGRPGSRWAESSSPPARSAGCYAIREAEAQHEPP
jgi:hypothetical protein